MAHFAELDQDNVVLRVICIGDWVIVDENNIEQEQRGIDFCKNLFGQNTIWLQTSYNTLNGKHINGKTPLRKNYAGIGCVYDSVRDAFISPKPDGDGWFLDEEMCTWRNSELEEAYKAPQIGVTIGVTYV